MPKSLRDSLKSKCKHFNGTMNKVCEAGIAYTDVATVREPQGTGRSLPCLLDEGAKPCEKCSVRTDAEVDVMIAEIAKRHNNIAVARKAIVDFLGPWKKGTVGTLGQITCPVCQNVLRFSRAGSNGHIYAHCHTPGCVSWME